MESSHNIGCYPVSGLIRGAQNFIKGAVSRELKRICEFTLLYLDMPEW
jgi:hypothetical protein